MPKGRLQDQVFWGLLGANAAGFGLCGLPALLSDSGRSYISITRRPQGCSVFNGIEDGAARDAVWGLGLGRSLRQGQLPYQILDIGV